MTDTVQNEAEPRRVILLHGARPEVWLSTEGALHTLPEFDIPRSQRITECLASAVRQTLGITAVSISALPPAAASVRHQIMESCASEPETSGAKEWVSIDFLQPKAFRDAHDFVAIRDAVAQCRDHQDKEPFRKLGWFDRLRRWVQGAIEPYGLRLRVPFRQLNASAAFSLIRFETDGPPVWFKATGAPNAHEFLLTLTLSRLFSRFLPHILATRPDWNGWLTLNAEGIRLDQALKPDVWTAAAGDLADLQIASLGRSTDLLDVGARDLCSAALRSRVEPFFRSIGTLMERQTKVPPPVLSGPELRELSARVSEALAALDETGFPATLGHLDINPGNIVHSPGSTIFLDWAEGFVGHPFLTFEYYLEFFRRTFGSGHAAESQLVERYIAPWRAIVSERAILRALEAACLVAVFACATGNELWNNPKTIEEPRTASYLRALTRRMHHQPAIRFKRSFTCPG